MVSYTKYLFIRYFSSGANPKIHGSRPIGNKQPWNLSNKDIDRSVPRNLHIGLDTKPILNMKTEDIPGAQPHCVKFSSTRIGGNPLNPSYKLQSVSYLEPEATKFIKDPLAHDDIDGSRATKKK